MGRYAKSLSWLDAKRCRFECISSNIAGLQTETDLHIRKSPRSRGQRRLTSHRILKPTINPIMWNRSPDTPILLSSPLKKTFRLGEMNWKWHVLGWPPSAIRLHTDVSKMAFLEWPAFAIRLQCRQTCSLTWVIRRSASYSSFIQSFFLFWPADGLLV